ncbi:MULTISPECIES: MFS transporter [Amycolatopsis]|uniref:MFS transporter n=1 Tax=Amycolatopsis TaxID=1813 RepID=UPI000B8A8193|nr:MULTISPECIES: MFS transporter [Amycolatopsis]OXM75278.1 MFS transporter [Amycolatopsis sp. KNN50.9b]
MAAATTHDAGRGGTGVHPLPAWRGRVAVLSVTTGIFVIVTTEILPIGLLTPIGAAFAVSDGSTGLMMTMPGILAAIAAPVITVVTARLDRRRMLCAFLAVLTVANVVAAAAPGYWAVLVSRVLVGVTIGGFWAIASGLAERLVPPRSAARATAVIFSAVPLGSVLGVPAGTFLGDLSGWRTAFVVLAVLSGAVLAALAVVLPPLPPLRATSRGVLTAVLGRPGTRAALLVTVLVVLAHFGAYTYVRPFLEQVTEASPAAITVVLLIYGTAGIAGNFLAGAGLPRYPRVVFGVSAGLLAAATTLLPLAGTSLAGAVALLVAWGLAYGAVPVASHTWFALAAPRAAEAASVLFTASFQATIALGALAGGFVVDRSSASAVMVCGGLTAAAGVVAIAAGGARSRSSPA